MSEAARPVVERAPRGSGRARAARTRSLQRGACVPGRAAAQLNVLDAGVRVGGGGAGGGSGSGGNTPVQARHCLRSCRDERGVYHCPRCARQYRHKQSLSRHLQHECDRRRWLACPRCPHRTASAARLRLHMAAVHQLALVLPALASAYATSQ